MTPQKYNRNRNRQTNTQYKYKYKMENKIELINWSRGNRGHPQIA